MTASKQRKDNMKSTKTFEQIPRDRRNKKRVSGDKVVNALGLVIRYGFYVRLDTQKSQRNVSYIIAEDWEELRGTIIDHFDLIVEDLPEETMRRVFEKAAVFANSDTFVANGREYLIER